MNVEMSKIVCWRRESELIELCQRECMCVCVCLAVWVSMSVVSLWKCAQINNKQQHQQQGVQTKGKRSITNVPHKCQISIKFALCSTDNGQDTPSFWVRLIYWLQVLLVMPPVGVKGQSALTSMERVDSTGCGIHFELQKVYQAK